MGRLRQQLAKAKSINDTMWETAVQRLVAEGKQKQREQDSEMEVDESEDETRRKRGRT